MPLAKPVSDHVRKAAEAFGNFNRLTDDLTCVAVKVVDAPRALAHAELAIRSDLCELRRARAFVRECCDGDRERRLPDVDVAALELAVNEAASNIMKHAYHGRADQYIQLEAERFSDRVSIQLHHLGESFDPTAVPPPALDGSRESGFGKYLMANSVDEVRYFRDARGRNCIELVKVRTS